MSTAVLRKLNYILFIIFDCQSKTRAMDQLSQEMFATIFTNSTRIYAKMTDSACISRLESMQPIISYSAEFSESSEYSYADHVKYIKFIRKLIANIGPKVDILFAVYLD